MSQNELLSTALEQAMEQLEDPAKAVFSRMYEKFPQLAEFGDDKSGDWESYMTQEIFTNLFEYDCDPETALYTIKDMTDHHRLIGLPMEIFKGFYETLHEMIRPLLSDEKQPGVTEAWDNAISSITECIDQRAAQI